MLQKLKWFCGGACIYAIAWYAYAQHIETKVISTINHAFKDSSNFTYAKKYYQGFPFKAKIVFESSQLTIAPFIMANTAGDMVLECCIWSPWKTKLSIKQPVYILSSAIAPSSRIVCEQVKAAFYANSSHVQVYKIRTIHGLREQYGAMQLQLSISPELKYSVIIKDITLPHKSAPSISLVTLTCLNVEEFFQDLWTIIQRKNTLNSGTRLAVENCHLVWQESAITGDGYVGVDANCEPQALLNMQLDSIGSMLKNYTQNKF